MRDNVLEFVKGMPEVIAGNVLVAEGKGDQRDEPMQAVASYFRPSFLLWKRATP